MKRIVLISLAVLFLGAVVANTAESETMKVAVASSGGNTKASVNNKAAKCPYYVMFNSKGELIEVIDNPYSDASRGAGPLAANFLSQRGVTIVIAGDFGPKMISTLKAKGIAHFEFEGIVGDAVKRVLERRQ